MTKHRVSELEGALLDAAVAKAEGMTWTLGRHVERGVSFVGEPSVQCLVSGWKILGPLPFMPSQAWDHGGPILERERIQLWPDYCHPHGATDQWRAQCFGTWSSKAERDADLAPLEQGRTPLIAAMRAFVASKLGEETDL